MCWRRKERVENIKIRNKILETLPHSYLLEILETNLLSKLKQSSTFLSELKPNFTPCKIRPSHANSSFSSLTFHPYFVSATLR